MAKHPCIRLAEYWMEHNISFCYLQAKYLIYKCMSTTTFFVIDTFSCLNVQPP
uniref:Uncharacterized protein n=1 Tax=Arundo donax TaxID=35708 RepID=A0A0A9GR55_ARUDO